MSEKDDRANTRCMVMIAFRKPVRDSIESYRDNQGLPLSEAVIKVELEAICLYESLKRKKSKEERRHWEYQEKAVLDLIAILAKEIACTQ